MVDPNESLEHRRQFRDDQRRPEQQQNELVNRTIEALGPLLKLQAQAFQSLAHSCEAVAANIAVIEMLQRQQQQRGSDINQQQGYGSAGGARASN